MNVFKRASKTHVVVLGEVKVFVEKGKRSLQSFKAVMQPLERRHTSQPWIDSVNDDSEETLKVFAGGVDFFLSQGQESTQSI